jgi:hypothetical protein
MIAAGTVVFVLVASQVLFPEIAERKVENRLTAGGGTADVTVGAMPALRLLFGDGERFQIDAQDLDLPLDQDLHVFDRLDGFGIVDVAIADSRAGPFDIRSFTLTRETPGLYHLVTDADTTVAELADYGLDAVGVPAGGLFDALVEGLFGPSDSGVPVSLDMQLASDDGRVEVISGNASVAGVPAGPLAELITSAVVVSL